MTTVPTGPRKHERREATRLVIVDDSTEYRAMLSHVLRRDSRFQVVAEAADGVEGIAAVDDHAPDIVVTDLQMPNLDGIGLTRALRAMHGDLPIVMVTGLPGDEVVERAHRAGVTAFLPKTGSPARLVATLQAALDSRQKPEGVAG
jgi:CheY-like chemotaxis protein